MKLFTASQIRQWDTYTINNEPVGSLELMERAATKCFEWLLEKYPSENNIFYIFCGTGNNGGDGLAIARLLNNAGRKIAVYCMHGDNPGKDQSANLKKLIDDRVNVNTILTISSLPEIPSNAILIDALFGTGLNRPLTALPAAIVTYLNNQPNTIVSIDIPSGLSADTAISDNSTIIKARHTISFQQYKRNFLLASGFAFTGDIHIADIGLSNEFYEQTPSDWYTIDTELIRHIIPERHVFSHKYNFGHALLLAGSRQMPGAAILTAQACLRAGTGLVTLYCPELALPSFFQAVLPEMIASNEPDIEKLIEKKSAVGVGPGWSLTTENKENLAYLLKNHSEALIIDASALSLIKDLLPMISARKPGTTVLTPHRGEFEKLFGKQPTDLDTLNLAIHQSSNLQSFIVLKGHNTAVCCPDGNVYFNTTGNAGMATAGSGDTLTGIITGLAAQNYTLKNACLCGVFLHGLAGDLAAQELSEEALIAGDIIEKMGAAFKTIKDKHQY